jgi:hypothetical protein
LFQTLRPAIAGRSLEMIEKNKVADRQIKTGMPRTRRGIPLSGIPPVSSNTGKMPVPQNPPPKSHSGNSVHSVKKSS